MAQPPDPARCPLCGAPNACALARGETPAEACWCRAERFSEALLARVPEAARGVACICRACWERASEPPANG